MTSAIMNDDILLMNILQHKFGMVAGLTVSDNKIIECPGGIPSVEDQKKWSDQYEVYVSANEYKEKRKAEYDALNQFELISDDAIAGNGTSHRDAILAIKSKFPKPE